MMDSKSVQFVNDLVQFYRNRGHHNPQPQQFIARINGKIVDLCQLYSYVIESGGSFKVNQLNLWDDIYCKLFKTSFSGANIAVALRQIYCRYLLTYEKTFSSNFGNDLLDDDEDESNFSFNSNHNHNHNQSFNSLNTSFSIPFSLNTSQHQITQNVSTNSTENRNPLNKVFCSLLSGLPNELDFAVKVSTILVNSNRFDWSSDYKYIQLLLECSKNYCCVCDQPLDKDYIPLDLDLTVDLFEQNTCNCYQKFWYQCCSDEQTLELVFGALNPALEELSQNDFNKIEERVRLIADIIRNLSFTYDSENHETMTLTPGSVATPLLMKFLLLLSMSSEQQFNNIALDILSNIAPTTAVLNDDNDYTIIQQILHRRCVEIAMTSNNIYWTSRCLEIISRLFAVNIEEFTSFLELHLQEYEVFVRITQLMTCQYDIPLLLAILEFTLALSQQKPYMLVKEENKHLIKILLTLLNCESSQHFTTTALKRMKVIDDRPRTQTIQTPESNSGQTTVQTQSVSSGQTTVQTNGVDNETFAMNWLRTTYEPNVNLNDNQTLKAADLYAEYVKHCCRNSRRNVMAAQPFSQLIKRCFPSSSLTNNQNIIEGIVAKSIPNIQNKSNPTVGKTSQLMSPILKAHLSAPPKNSNASTPPTNTTTNCNNSNLITNSIAITSTTTSLNSSSLSIPTTNTSTLIKSLLANKLRSNATISSASTPSTTTSAVTPTKSTINSNVCANTIPIFTSLTTTSNPITTTTASNANFVTCNETNGDPLSNGSTPLPSAITITPSISLTPTNTIISSTNSSISAPSVQPQQQFLLVRTIITSPGQHQAGGSGLTTTTGTPVRLILPASMLTQQRLNSSTINGITTTSSPLTTVSFSTGNNLMTNKSTTTIASTNTSDLFLKTVLSNTNANSMSVPPIRSNVKSSPLLNVLLDKGKLPEFSTSSVVNNQMSGSMTVSSQAPKMYILTTKSPLAMKSVPTLQTQQFNQTAQPLGTICAPLQTQNNITLKSCLQSSTNTVNVNKIVTTVSSALTSSTTTHSVANKQSIPKSCITPTINGEMGSPILTVNNVVNSVNTIHNITTNCIDAISAVNSVGAGNTETLNINSVNAINNNIPSSDLSPIKDIKKAVDDATRLMKRPNDDTDSIASNKKLKINSVLTIPSSALLTNNSIQNHDLNCNSDSISINNCLMNTNSQQVLTKASALMTTTPSSAVTTITTITSNNIKAICNTNNNNSSNNNNSNSVTPEFECQWNECKKTFSRAAEVFLHVHNQHIMSTTFPDVMNCLWGGPEGTGPGCLSKRPKLSLLTHLLDFHCNPNVLQQDSIRKKQLSSVGSSAIVLPQPPAHPGYAHNAALLAIRRHANNYVEAPVLPPITKWTPLTVSIRLTSALILRNLALNSNFVKRTLEYFEQYLCELCMSEGRDESRTIAQCLALITDKT